MNVAGIAVGISIALGGVICVFLANYQYWELRFEVNERLPEGQKFEPLFWTPLIHLEFWRLHKTVLPQSPRLKRALRLATMGICLFFLGLAVILVAANSW